jgi:hypothetical protein
MGYYSQPCTVYFGPCTLCGAAWWEYQANSAFRVAPDQFDCGLEDRLPTGGGVAVLFVKELLGRHTRRDGMSGIRGVSSCTGDTGSLE